MVLESESALREIASIRHFITRGRRSRAKGGWHLIGVGLLFGSASVCHWSLQNGLLPLPKHSVAYLWGAAAILTIALSVVLNEKSPKGTTADVVYRATRQSVLLVVILSWLLICLTSWRFQNSDIMEVIAPTAATLNGGYWLIFSALQERHTLRWVPYLSFVAAIVLALMLWTPHFYLVNAIACFGLLVVPGLYLKQSIPPSEAEED